MGDKNIVLIIEDEEDILELEEFYLQRVGFETMGFLSTKGVKEALDEEDISLMVVDRNLPLEEGSKFIEELRAKGYDTPVIFVSAKVEDRDIEEGFLRGGDDYLRKPFNMNELVLRVKALLKRCKKLEQNIIHYRNLTLNLDTRELKRFNRELHLSPLEFELLYYFIEHRARVITREELLESIWGGDISKKGINIAINRLKKKIESKIEPPYIEAVRGVGYKLC